MKPSNWIVMDILGTYIYHMAYRNPGDPIDCNKKKYTSDDHVVYETSRRGIHEHVLDSLIRKSQDEKASIIDEYEYKELVAENYYDRNIPPRPILTLRLTDGVLKKHFPFLKEYTSVNIHNMFKSAADCKVGMYYPVRFLEGRSTHNKKYNNFDYPCSFFTMTDVDCSKVSKDGNVLERRYTVKFDTCLGYFFIHNVLSCYTDWLPMNFYQLSDTAQLYYRRCVLPFYNGVKSTLTIEEVQSRLQLKTPDTHGLRRVIKNGLAELEAATYIKNAKEEYLHGHFRYTAYKTPWTQMNRN